RRRTSSCRAVCSRESAAPPARVAWATTAACGRALESATSRRRKRPPRAPAGACTTRQCRESLRSATGPSSAQQLDDQPHDHVRRVKLAPLFPGIVGELLDQVLVGAREHVGLSKAVVAQIDL